MFKIKKTLNGMFFLILFTNFINCMEENEKKSRRRNEKRVNKNQPSITPYNVNNMPFEILLRIACQILSVQGYDKQIEAIITFKRFSYFIWSIDKKVPINFIEYFFDIENIYIYSDINVNPFLLAQRLKIKLKDDLKEKLTELAIENQIKKYNLTHEKLEAWLSQQNIYQKQLELGFFNVTRRLEEDYIIYLLTLLYKKTSVDFLYHLEPHYTALIYASYRQCEHLVEILLNCGANPNLINKYGDTALCRASTSPQNSSIINLLLIFGANINIRCENESTCLINAALNGCEKIVEILLNAGIDPNLKEKNGNTALIRAATSDENVGIIKHLLKSGAKIDMQNFNGDTALIKAADYSCSAIFTILLENRANTDLKNENGYTALHFVKKNKNKNMKKILKSFGLERNKCVSS